MIQSMTGFGKAEQQYKNSTITVEIRTLNSKNQDFSFRTPNLYKSVEMDLRRLLSDQLQRGKVSVMIGLELNDDSLQQRELNHSLIKNYLSELKKITPNAADLDLLPIAMSLPNVLNTPNEDLDKEEKNALIQCFNQAIEHVNQFRSHEGAALQDEFQTRIQNILNFLNQIQAFEAERIPKIKEKIQHQLNDLKQEINLERLEQELIYYLEKLDIAEEKQRLKKHCDYFLEELNGNESNGKKLGFITQEIGREINTLGSKSNHYQMQNIVVQMKDELEKIKEQVLNVL